MKKIGFSFWLLLFIVACTPKTYTPSVADVQISSTAPVVPVLKGIDQNPLLRLRIYVPAGGEQNLQNIVCTLNDGGISNIEQLDVYFTGSEPNFSATNGFATIVPSSKTFEILFNRNLKPGLHYIWFSAKLKETADMDGRVALNATAVTDGGGRKLAITSDGGEYNKRIGVAIRKAWNDSVHTYRIPGIITTDKGTLIAVYDIRYKHSGDLPANIDVGMSRSSDGGKTWEGMMNIMDMGAPHENNGVGDPSILFDPVTKKIWVSALWSKGNRSIAGSQPGLSPDETGQFVLVSSDDDGITWNKPYTITPQVKNPAWKLFFPGPGNGIAMQNGTLVFPAQYWDADHMPHSTLVYSTDHGTTWKSGVGAKSNTTESQLVETTPGTIMLNMRDNRGRFRSIATTTDMGQTWVEHHTSYKALPDPVCMASFIKANVNVNGKMPEVLFFSNVASQTARVDMTVKASMNLGETWSEHDLLIDERRSFGYSALTKIDNNTLGLLYEGNRDLYFVRIPVSEVIK